ncbi:MAG: hypothetical protein H6555_04920 [Lewinellaceae bacterium]|nr:hypothetical protein [Lewinellaceae bacterium]
MARKKKQENDPNVHEDLEGFDIRINEFGEIVSTFGIEQLNSFLDENVADKKLQDRGPESSNDQDDANAQPKKEE